MMLSMTASAIMVHPDVLATEWVSRVVTLAAVGGGALAVRGRQQAKEAEHKAAEECRRAAELAFQRDAAIRRSRIAGQLHDSVGQGLTVIIALSEGLAGKTDDPRVEDALHGINEIARESLGDTRKAVRALTEFDGAANDDGTGLVRLFHRVESASGIFEYGPNEDGEWVVEATIPSNGVNEKDHTA